MAEDDGLQHFLSHAGDHRLLTAAEEKALGRRVQDDPRGPDGRAARNELVLANIRLVVSVARYYRNRGLPMSDVVQNGIIGLNRAAEKFDPDKDIRFSTYATLWIKQAIQRGLTSGSTAIRLPSTVAANRAKVRAVLLRQPDAEPQFIADLLDLDIAEVERAVEAAEVVTSLDRELATEENSRSPLLDSMRDENAIDPFEAVGDDHTEELYEALSKLPRNHRRVIEMHFGLRGKKAMTVAEIAAALGTGFSVNTVKTLRSEAMEFIGHRLDHHR